MERTAELFKSMGDPTRLAILCLLLDGEKPVGALAEVLSHTSSSVSHQLRILRGMRLVRSRRSGQHIFYALDDQHIADLIEVAIAHVEENASGFPPQIHRLQEDKEKEVGPSVCKDGRGGTDRSTEAVLEQASLSGPRSEREVEE